MTTAYSGDGITFPDASVQATAPRVGMVNRIINGDMRIDQRNGGASVTNNVSNAQYSVDRWKFLGSVSAKFTAQQNAGSVTPPLGFTNYLGVTSLSAYTVGAGDYFAINHEIEGFNVADLGFGTVSASSVTISFWVYSSLTGTFGAALTNSSTRGYPFTYTISSANTWEKKIVSIAGDTTGTWNVGNSIGLRLKLGLGVGSTYSGTAGSWVSGNLISATGATSVVGTSGATFYVTGVQLEKGSTATSFEYVDYGRQLIQCKRYYEIIESGEIPENGNYYANWRYVTPIRFEVAKRGTPTIESITQNGYPNGIGGTYLVSAATLTYVTFIGTAGAAQTNTLHRYAFAANSEL